MCRELARLLPRFEETTGQEAAAINPSAAGNVRLSPSPMWGEGWGEGLSSVGVAGCCSMLGWRCIFPLAGMCARRRTYFSLRRQRKVGKRKATPLAVSLRFASGNLRCSRLGRCCGTRFVRCAHAAQTAAASQITMHGHTALPMPAPRPALLGTARGDLNSNTGHCCARPRQQPTPRPSAAMARVVFPPPCIFATAVLVQLSSVRQTCLPLEP